MIVGVDPKVDYAFKHLYGREETRPLLIDLTNCVLAPAAGHAIAHLDLLNPFNPKETLDDKLSILDVKARDQCGRQFNVEMQMLAFRYYEKRILYYWAKLHQQQLREGQDYLNLKPTISISFLDHVLFPEAPDYRWRFRLLDEQRRCFTDDIELHVIELPKFAKTAAELASDFEVWLYFLRHAAMIDMDDVPVALKRPLVLQALEELKMLAQTDEERERYESRRKAQLDYNTGLKVARMEGELKGRMEGRMEGITEGRREGDIKRIHFCERLLKRPETAAESLAGLSQEELGRIAQELEEALSKGV
jgi:predicted transposase/invertase (TIGR01784 family)